MLTQNGGWKVAEAKLEGALFPAAEVSPRPVFGGQFASPAQVLAHGPGHAGPNGTGRALRAVRYCLLLTIFSWFTTHVRRETEFL